MKLNRIYNEDCFKTMERMSSELCTNILTSPFYNTNKKQCKSNTLMKSNNASSKFPYLRYDTHVDNMTDEEYCNFTHKLFLEFDRILNPHGTVLYNLSYGNNNRDGMFKASPLWGAASPLPSSMRTMAGRRGLTVLRRVISRSRASLLRSIFSYRSRVTSPAS